jgi:hypothetical protein
MSMTGASWGVHTMPGMGMVGRNFDHLEQGRIV